MKIEKNISLKKFNSFGIDVKASHYVKINSTDELSDVLSSTTPSFNDPFILSGGSNLLLMNDLDRLVIHLGIKGIEILEETDEIILVKVMAGEVWHQFVLWCIENNFGGLENLSLIPGYVGSAPIQNIGAYGVEQADYFHSCEVLERKTLEFKTLMKSDCKFGYRDSIFKSKNENEFIITAVTYQLTKNKHNLHLTYGAIRSVLEQKKIGHPTIKDISDVVIAIRTDKLPNPKEIGNSGSFFKNPVITTQELGVLQKSHPTIPIYKQENNTYKVAAGWLIEKAGFKGKRTGNVGTHHKQALVLVNYENATGQEVFNFAKDIIEQVQKQFNILLEPEVRIIY